MRLTIRRRRGPAPANRTLKGILWRYPFGGEFHPPREAEIIGVETPGNGGINGNHYRSWEGRWYRDEGYVVLPYSPERLAELKAIHKDLCAMEARIRNVAGTYVTRGNFERLLA